MKNLKAALLAWGLVAGLGLSANIGFAADPGPLLPIVKTTPIVGAGHYNWQSKSKSASVAVTVRVLPPVASKPQEVQVTRLESEAFRTSTYQITSVSADLCGGVIYAGVGVDASGGAEGWVVVYDWRERNIEYCGDELKLLAKYPEYERAATIFEKSPFDSEPKIFRQDRQ